MKQNDIDKPRHIHAIHPRRQVNEARARVNLSTVVTAESSDRFAETMRAPLRHPAPDAPNRQLFCGNRDRPKHAGVFPARQFARRPRDSGSDPRARGPAAAIRRQRQDSMTSACPGQTRPAIRIRHFRKQETLFRVTGQYLLAHIEAFANPGLCQIPSAAMSTSACFGPQLPDL